MKKAFAAACLLFLFCGSINAQEPATPAAPGIATGPQITFVNSDSVFDLGGVPVGTVLENQFEIKNTGTMPLIISGMTCVSGNLQFKWPHKPVKPGKKAYLNVTYTARGDEGSFAYSIFITSNATASPYPFINVSGAIIPAGGSYIPSSRPSSKGKGGRGSRGN